MSLVGDIIDRVLFPNREIHVIPVLDGAFSPNQRLDQREQLGEEIERPDDLALGPDGALYVSSGTAIIRCAGDGFRRSRRVRQLCISGRRVGLDRRRAPDRVRLEAGSRRAVGRRGDRSASSTAPAASRSRCPTSVDRRRGRHDLRDRRIARQSAGALAGGSDAEPARPRVA